MKSDRREQARVRFSAADGGQTRSRYQTVRPRLSGKDRRNNSDSSWHRRCSIPVSLRGIRVTRLLRHLPLDVRCALRALRHAPLFTVLSKEQT